MSELEQKKSFQIERHILGSRPFREILLQRYAKRYSDYRQQWAKAGRGGLITDFPLQIDLDTVDDCNLRCAHCQEENTRRRTKAKMSYDFIDAIFNEASRYRLCALNVGAIGEPLLEKEILFYMLSRAKEAGVMETFMHTNGILLDSEVAEGLLNSDLTYLCISVDAAREETYKSLRGGSLVRLRQNIERFIRLRNSKDKIFPILRVSFLIQDRNRTEKQAFMDAWSDLADIIDYQPIINYENINNCDSRHILSCFNPFTRLMIGPSFGEIGACCSGIAFNEDVVLGNFPETSIYEAWNSRKVKQLRDSMLTMNLDDFPTCLDCLRRR